MQVSKFTSQDEAFPDIFNHLEQPPKNINVLGELPEGHYVSIVGSRRPTPYGEQITYQLAGELAQAGVVIVSGLAIGIDGIAHQAALDAGGRTVAVLAHGLDRVYPSRHRELAKAVLAGGGALVSEYDFGVAPLKHHFLERNRLIAAISPVTVVTEAGEHSGSLVTARAARDIGRTVMAVPGNITSVYSSGPNMLLRNGAVPVTNAFDVLTELGYNQPRPARTKPAGEGEDLVIELLRSGASSQTVIERSGLSAAEVANIISLLEITGRVQNLGAGTWAVR